MKSWKKVIWIFLISRCLITIALLDRVYPYADHQWKMDHPLLDPFIIYDSYNYAQIALEGYDELRLTAFFPLYPLLIRALVFLTGLDVYWIGFALSNLFFIASLWLLDQLLEKREYSVKSRMAILLTVAFFPSSYYFSAFYTESFFLFLALFSFKLWEQEKRGWAYLIAGFATLTRMVGVWIPLAFFLDRMMRRRLDGRDFAYSFGTFLLFLLYPVYLWLEKGDPLAFVNVQEPFYSRLSVPPFYPIYQDILWSIEKWNRELWVEPIIVFHLILFALFISYLMKIAKAWRRGTPIRWAEFFYTVGLTVFPLSSMLYTNQEIASHGYMRYILPSFPLFIYMGHSLHQVIFHAAHATERIKRLWLKFCICSLITGWILMSGYIWLGLRFKGFLA